MHPETSPAHRVGPDPTSLRLGSLAAYIDFIFNGIVLCLTNFFGICWNEVTAAPQGPPHLARGAWGRNGRAGRLPSMVPVEKFKAR